MVDNKIYFLNLNLMLNYLMNDSPVLIRVLIICKGLTSSPRTKDDLDHNIYILKRNNYQINLHLICIKKVLMEH